MSSSDFSSSVSTSSTSSAYSKIPLKEEESETQKKVKKVSSGCFANLCTTIKKACKAVLNWLFCVKNSPGKSISSDDDDADDADGDDKPARDELKRQAEINALKEPSKGVKRTYSDASLFKEDASPLDAQDKSHPKTRNDEIEALKQPIPKTKRADQALKKTARSASITILTSEKSKAEPAKVEELQPKAEPVKVQDLKPIAHEIPEGKKDRASNLKERLIAIKKKKDSVRKEVESPEEKRSKEKLAKKEAKDNIVKYLCEAYDLKTEKKIDLTAPIEGVKGLPNLGNSCYMNASLQLLQLQLSNDEEFEHLIAQELRMLPDESLEGFEQRVLNAWAPLKQEKGEELKVYRDRILFKFSFLILMQAKLHGTPEAIHEAIHQHRELCFSAKLHSDFLAGKNKPKDSGEYLEMWHQVLQWTPLRKLEKHSTVHQEEIVEGTPQIVPLSFLQCPIDLNFELSENEMALVEAGLFAFELDQEEIINKEKESLEKTIETLEQTYQKQEKTKTEAEEKKKQAEEKAKGEEAAEAEVKKNDDVTAKAEPIPQASEPEARPNTKNAFLRLRAQKKASQPEKKAVLEVRRTERMVKRYALALERTNNRLAAARKELAEWDKDKILERKKTAEKNKLIAQVKKNVQLDGKKIFANFFADELLKNVQYETAEFGQFTAEDSVRENKLVDPLPNSLILQFKRFAFHEGISSKIENPIDFSKMQTLKLHKYVANKGADIRFAINAFVVHESFGTSKTLDNGHYIAYVKHGDAWYRCDDSRTQKLEEEPPFHKAYICSYERI